MENKINIKIKMFTKFKNFLPDDASDGKAEISIEEGSTLEDLKNLLGIGTSDFDGLVIDGTNWEIEDSQVLKDGDTYSFFAAVAGG
jgi:molybdopterin converting factor small subunit